jgi:predicted nucleic acid-binding protein
VTTSPALIVDALDLHALRGVSFYDALIVQAAVASGCERLLSEHLQDCSDWRAYRQSLQGLILRRPLRS